MSDLLPVEDALQQILAHIPAPKVETIALEDALGRVLAGPITSDAALPPFDNSAVDGFAVRHADLQAAATTLTIIMDIPAGTAPHGSLRPGEAARIMTGAPVPDGADTVVAVEQTNLDFAVGDTLPETVTVQEAPPPGANIRQTGENVRPGDQILAGGTVLRPQDIGMLAAIGAAKIPVYQKPKVAIISTGDELLGVDEPLSPGKIRDSNSYTLAGLVTQVGGDPHRYPPAADTLDAVRGVFAQALDDGADMVISSAGVSVGSYDVVRQVLDELGEIGFWRVNVRPGKPLAFGSLRGVPFFGLPGNPVSAMVTFDIFVRPALGKLIGHEDDAETVPAIVGEPMTSDGRRTYARVALHRDGNQLVATSTGTQSSGALMSMVLADGLLIIPEGIRTVEAGTELPVRLLRKI